MTLRTILLDAKKAVGAFTSIEATAVGLGLLDNAVAGYVTAALGAATTVIVYLLENEKPAKATVPVTPAPAAPTA